MVNPVPSGVIFKRIRTPHLPLNGLNLIKSPKWTLGRNPVQDSRVQERASDEPHRLRLNGFGKGGIMDPERLIHQVKRLGDVPFPVAKVTPQREIYIN